MNTPSLIQQLFNAGSHFGFSKSRRHPSVTPYLFTTKAGTDIFDLEQTSKLLTDASEFLRKAGEEGKTVLFVSTKTEVSDLVRASADRANMPYVTNRWIGGILTNYSEIRKRISRFISLKEQSASGELDRKYTKKERLMISREAEKLEFNFGGIARIERTPDIMVVVDPRHDKVAVTEARDAKVPVVGIMCSDCDVSLIHKPVLANDSHRASVTTVLNMLVDALIDGRSRYTPKTVRPTDRRTSAGE
jgi:small subunit ribosomal protein S2